MTGQTLLSESKLNLISSSHVSSGDMEFALALFPEGRKFVALCQPEMSVNIEGERSEMGRQTMIIGPLSHTNIDFLRTHLKWLNPSLLGLKTSAGLGDRIGLATPGHVRAVRTTSGKIAPIFAQQSIREMTRTNRTPQQVMDDAAWGIFSEGWQSGFGADADHLKTFEDIDQCLAVGFTFYTIDPGAFVDDRAETASLDQLREMADVLPDHIQPRANNLLEKQFDFEGLKVAFDEYTLLKAAVKYGKAVDHVSRMYDHLAHAVAGKPFELEVSVDETEQPTTFSEHAYIAHELKRLGVRWVSLAPRYVGKFEKGVDYIGDVAAFETDITGHAAIARQLGPYKLSLHSGSDKFSIYPAAMHQTRGLVHLKTAGTSYLEALRTIASIDVKFFQEVYVFAREHYEADRASYHLSAELDRAPHPNSISDWPELLDQFDAREILHTTFGSVLTDRSLCLHKGLHDRLIEILQANPEAYAENLKKHFVRHLTPFMK